MLMPQRPQASCVWTFSSSTSLPSQILCSDPDLQSLCPSTCDSTQPFASHGPANAPLPGPPPPAFSILLDILLSLSFLQFHVLAFWSSSGQCSTPELWVSEHLAALSWSLILWLPPHSSELWGPLSPGGPLEFLTASLPLLLPNASVAPGFDSTCKFCSPFFPWWGPEVGKRLFWRLTLYLWSLPYKPRECRNNLNFFFLN